MAAAATLIALVAIVVGIAGIIIPVIPGSSLMGVALAVWAVVIPSWPARLCAIAGIVILVGTAILQYVVAGKRLKGAGIPNVTLAAGAVVGIAGMFVIPVVGLLLGFIVGVVISELVRQRAWTAALPSAWHAVKAVLISVGVELVGASLTIALWTVGVILAWEPIRASGQGWLF